MQPSPPLPPEPDWTIPDDIVDFPYDAKPVQTRSLHFGRRALLAVGLLFLLALLLVLGSLAYKFIGRLRVPSAAITAPTNPPPAASLALGSPSGTPASSDPLISSSRTPPTQRAEPLDPSPNALLPTSSPTLTPGPPVGATSGVPLGHEGGYLLHQVLPGESLAGLAEEYNTSIEVLTAANQPVQVFVTAQAVLAAAKVELQGAVLPPGTRLVILPGLKDPAGVPRFEVVYIDVETSVSALAELKSISVAGLREINDLGGSDWIPPGRYLIIPEK